MRFTNYSSNTLTLYVTNEGYAEQKITISPNHYVAWRDGKFSVCANESGGHYYASNMSGGHCSDWRWFGLQKRWSLYCMTEKRYMMSISESGDCSCCCRSEEISLDPFVTTKTKPVCSENPLVKEDNGISKLL